MASSPPLILFFSHPKTPVFFQSAVNTYYLCPDCLRSREARYCSGRTTISHEMCEVHRYLIDSNTNTKQMNTSFDPDDLTYFRKALLDGTLRNDFNLKQAYLKAQKKASWWRPDRLCRRAAIPPSPKTDNGHAQNDKYAVGEDSSISGSPTRKANRHLTPLETPKWTDNPRRVSEAASTASSSSVTGSTATTDSNPSSNLSTMSGLDANPNATTFPTPLITYAHDPFTHCILSPFPRFLLFPPPLLHALNTHKLHRLRELREQYDLCWGQDGDLKTEHRRLLEEVRVGRIGSGVFSRRCNGEWVNGVGEEVGELREGIDGEVVDEGTVVREWERMRLDARMAALDVAGMKRKVLSEMREDSSDSNSSTESSSVSATPSASTTGSTSSTCSTPSTSRSTRAAELEADPHEEADPNRHEPETPDPQAHITSSTINAKMPLSFLQARESLVHQGKTTEEDFILTCWATNSRS